MMQSKPIHSSKRPISKMHHQKIKSNDGTTLLKFSNGIKTVIIPAKEKNALCISSQIGCKMRCEFCRAGKFIRNLTAKEIVSQYEYAVEEIRIKPNSIVVMGMGEPMLNFENVDAGLRKIHEKHSLSFKNMTISTCGINLEKLYEAPYLIAISLHSADDKNRQKMMPGTVQISEIVNFTKRFSDKKHGIMIEYAMISGINDSDENLKTLLNLGWPKNVNFNLIEFNDYKNYKKSNRIMEFKKAIISAGYKCFIRTTRGKDIDAACGMLDYK